MVMSGADKPTAQTAQTVLFVDIDGVLNVGIRDGPRSPIGFSKRNIDYALAIKRAGKTHKDQESLERLLAVHAHQVAGEAIDYADYVSDTSTECANIFAKRLAELISTAGSRRTVVLSSTWRQPQHFALVKQLEEVISSHLNYRFTFDARTPLGYEDRTPEGRLRIMGNYLEDHFRGAERVRVLVLEDFHINPLDGTFSCDGDAMNSTVAVEKYLLKRSPVPAAVRLIHTYDTWTEPGGMRLQIGCGLTVDHFQHALTFLGAEQTLMPESPAKESEVEEGSENSTETYLKASALNSPISPLPSKWFSFPEFLMPQSSVQVI